MTELHLNSSYFGDAKVEGDVNGDGRPDFAILLKHVTSLAVTDFDL